MTKAKKPAMSAKGRMGAVIVGGVMCLLGLLLFTSPLGQWLLLLGGIMVVVNLLLAGVRLMRDG